MRYWSRWGRGAGVGDGICRLMKTAKRDGGDWRGRLTSWKDRIRRADERFVAAV